MNAKRWIALALCLVLTLGLLAGCGKSGEEKEPEQTQTEQTEQTQQEQTQQAEPEKEDGQKANVASAEDMTDVVDVVEEGMVPVSGSDLVDGIYDVNVDSSSSMFKISAAKILVSSGKIMLILTMKSDAYSYMYAGTAEQAAAAKEEDLLPLTEKSDGSKTFTFAIDALDAPITCAAYSARKELWYPRTLLARADSLPLSAFKEDVLVTPDKLKLDDGEYSVAVTLSGGSGKTTVESPTKLVVKDGVHTATVTFSSSHYDYVLVGEDKYLPVNTEGNSAFELPVSVYDRPMAIVADTTAMSTPHEIAYSLVFDSSSVTLVKAAEAEPATETGEETTPAPAPSPEPEPEPTPSGPADGTYTVSLSFSGGTGKAYILSPCTVTVSGGVCWATLVWSSTNYDYMIVGGVKYYNENPGGNSTFTVPVVLGQYMTVIGDTVAMSTPHEVEYTIYLEPIA